MNSEIYFATAAGVAISILLPVLTQAVRQEFKTAVPQSDHHWRITRVAIAAWPLLRKYSLLFVFSLLTALIVVALLGDAIVTSRAALLAGYAWDSTIQKFRQKA